MRSPRSRLSSRLNKPSSLQPSSQESCSSPLTISVALLWTPSNSSPSFLCWDPQPRMQHCRWGLPGAEQRGTITSPSLLTPPALLQLSTALAFRAVSAHCWLLSGFSPTRTPSRGANWSTWSSCIGGVAVGWQQPGGGGDGTEGGLPAHPHSTHGVPAPVTMCRSSLKGRDPLCAPARLHGHRGGGGPILQAEPRVNPALLFPSSNQVLLFLASVRRLQPST